MKSYVNTTTKGGVATIEFFTEAHNSLPSDTLAELAQTITAVGADPEVVVIVLRSGGERTFCAGASFTELVAIEDFTTGKLFFLGFATVINAMRTCPKLIICRVQGKSVGGGVGIASAADYCMATQYGSVKLSELAVGIGPFVIGPAVERKIGLSAFSEMAINATEWRTATWAKDKGLYNEVFDTVEQLDAYILHFTDILRTMNPEAMALLKKVFWQGTDHWDALLEDRAETSGRLVLSDFSKQAIGAFLKR